MQRHFSLFRTLSFATIAACLFMGNAAVAQVVDPNSDLGQFRAHRETAMKAFDSADYRTALSEIKLARAILPDSPSTLLIEGQIYLEQRNNAKARTVVKEYLARGYVLDLKKHPEFNLVLDPELKDLQARNQKPVGQMSMVASIPGFQVHEGVAFNPETQEIYITAIRTGTLSALTTQGPRKVIGFRPGVAAYGLGYSHGALWVTTVASKLTVGYSPATTITSKVLKIDPSNGAILATFTDPDPGRTFGRLLAGREDLYVIDTAKGEILRLPGYQGKLETLVPEGYFDSPQALTETEDGGVLIVSDFVSGLYRIDLMAGSLGHLIAPDDGTLLGISHLSRHGNDLIAIQTGFRPNRVLRLKMSADWRNVTGTEVLIRSEKALSQPTQAMVVADTLVFIARSQWDNYDEKGGVLAGEPEPSIIGAVKLSGE